MVTQFSSKFIGSSASICVPPTLGPFGVIDDSAMRGEGEDDPPGVTRGVVDALPVGVTVGGVGPFLSFLSFLLSFLSFFSFFSFLFSLFFADERKLLNLNLLRGVSPDPLAIAVGDPFVLSTSMLPISVFGDEDGLLL